MKILLAILLLSTGVFAQSSLNKVAWLAGCWGGDLNGGKYEECWTAPMGNFMQGSARLVKGDQIFMREAITIEKEGDEIMMYVFLYEAKIKAEQPPIGFKLVKSSPTELVFENPKHDFPQRILYTKNAKGNIVARVEQLDGSKPMKFPMNRK